MSLFKNAAAASSVIRNTTAAWRLTVTAAKMANKVGKPSGTLPHVDNKPPHKDPDTRRVFSSRFSR